MVPSASHNLKKVANENVEPGFAGPVVPEALDKIAAWMKKTLRIDRSADILSAIGPKQAQPKPIMVRKKFALRAQADRMSALRSRLQQQHIDAMRVDHFFAWRPRENVKRPSCEATSA